MPVLNPGAIYAALYWRPDSKCHWAIIVADDSTSGQKLHATNLESPAWQYACDDFGVTTEQKPLVILGQIGMCNNMPLFSHLATGRVRRVSAHGHTVLTTCNYRENEVQVGERWS